MLSDGDGDRSAAPLADKARTNGQLLSLRPDGSAGTSIRSPIKFASNHRWQAAQVSLLQAICQQAAQQCWSDIRSSTALLLFPGKRQLGWRTSIQSSKLFSNPRRLARSHCPYSPAMR